MTTFISSRCRTCNKVANFIELVDNPAGIGMVCTDSSACQVRAIEQLRAQEFEEVANRSQQVLHNLPL